MGPRAETKTGDSDPSRRTHVYTRVEIKPHVCSHGIVPIARHDIVIDIVKAVLHHAHVHNFLQLYPTPRVF